MSNPKVTIFVAIVCLAVCGLSLAGDIPDPNLYPELSGDKMVNFVDFALFANNWMSTGVGLVGDFDDSNSVDYNDLFVMAYCWLEGPRPKTIFEQFKTALAAGDVNEALTFISEISREKYAAIFQIIEPNLPSYVAGMGDLIFDTEEKGKEKYEMLHQKGEVKYLFPVIFIKDEQGNWKIYNF